MKILVTELEIFGILSGPFTDTLLTNTRTGFIMLFTS